VNDDGPVNPVINRIKKLKAEKVNMILTRL